jgi:hypothetical protein
MTRQEIVEPLFGLGVDPPAKYASASKREGMYAAAVDYGKFHVPVEWRSVYRFPVHGENQSSRTDSGL